MSQPDPAAGRFWLLQAVRLSGVVLAALGAMVLAGNLDLPLVAGVVMLAAGLIEFFFVPALLARRWKSHE